MKKLIVLLMFMVNYSCFAQQESVFNLKDYKLYKIFISGINSPEKADYISRLTEKFSLCIFSYVFHEEGYGYFMVDNFYKVHEIEKTINNQNGLSYDSFEELQLTNDNFLEMYLRRGGIAKTQFSDTPPRKLIMGPNNVLTKNMFKAANDIWVNKYPENAGMVESYYIEKIRKELPRFTDTGNPEKDKQSYLKAKDKWIKENPDKYEKLLKYKEE